MTTHPEADMNILVLSSSLHPNSRSRAMAQHAFLHLTAQRPHGSQARWMDARDLDLPHCDGHQAWSHDGSRRLREALESADGIVLSYGVYNYAASASAKSLLEHGGSSWNDKPVGIVASAGGEGSRMAAMALVHPLMLDFRCPIVPQLVYASESAFEGTRIVNDDVARRINELAEEVARFTRALMPSRVGEMMREASEISEAPKASGASVTAASSPADSPAATDAPPAP
ncbi:MAG: NAD(P)H-dependent oxidoreductase [Planctomycetota bacterium]|nr:NAD(P)H-dependent oxidoreductase [Planctomycetota bacterium]MDA1106658.1 NAD(P)H-dependent oxidoreductase [Planctomycetota bacterium]